MNIFYLISLIAWAPLLTEPFQVVHGSAEAARAGHTLTIHNSDGAILHWEDFSIGKKDTLHFAQPYRQSIAINQVMGNQKSLIEGILSSNGKVAIINPHGIHINAGALVETAGFIASTASLTLDQGHLFFKDPGTGAIIHEGTIRCADGDIIFIANQIDHLGISEGANVHLLSGQEVWIKPAGKKRIYIQTKDWKEQDVSYQTAIQHSGQITAYGFKEEAGKVFLISSRGTSTIDGTVKAPAGEIHLLGQDVQLNEQAFVDASGYMGGTVLIGGSYQGSDPDIQNAQYTRSALGAVVKANSTGIGHGGTVVYWSDGITSVNAHTEVRGGPQGGDGGFIEISGREQFFYRGSTDRGAPLGKAGMLFFDPEADVTISAAPASNIDTVSPFILTDSPANILDTDLIAALNGGPVTIATNGPAVTTPGLGDLLFNTNLTWASNEDFVCTVGHDANIPTGVTLNNLGTGSLIIQANRAVIVSGTISLNGGDISLQGGSGGFLSDSYTGVSMGPNPGESALIQTTGTGNISLNGVGGNAPGSNGVSAGEFSNFAIQTAQGNIAITGMTNGGNGIYLIGGTITTQDGHIQLSGSSQSRGTVMHGGVNITATGLGSISCHGSSASDLGTYLFGAQTLQTVSGSIDIQGISKIGLLFNGAPANITSTSGDISLAASGPIAIELEKSTTIATTGSIFLTANGNLIILNNSSIRPNGDSDHPFIGSVQGNSTLVAGSSGSVQIGSQNVTSEAPIRINVSGLLSLTGFDPNYALIGHGDPTGGASTLSGNIDIQANQIALNSHSPAGFTQIGHVNQTGGGSTLSGNISVSTQQSVQLLGNATAYARIGHGGQGGTVTILPNTVQVIAGTHIQLVSGMIANMNGPLTLVVDNAFPDFPHYGAGAFFLDANSTLSSTRPLRLYSATQNQNTLSGSVNGQAFSPGPFDINSDTEDWSVYYPGGTYSNTFFKIYYKNPIIYDTQSVVSENIAANLVALDNLLPILAARRTPFRFPSYVSAICTRKSSDTENEKFPKCSPTLSPYGAFIFEDDVWWRTP